ncbi:MAG TPA: 3-deoxy-D-manno-octulosonic acid transferase [Acidobacteriota bacterium]|nr:3-deoxy-D-manno-octulosonic acid transferase [Acidobacteriota bacterium]
MYFLYSGLLVVWGILLVPAFLYKAWRRGTWLPGFSQRMGRLPESLRSDGRPTIWFHSCSVGETLSLQPLVHDLHGRFPDARFVFSTVTQTGQQIAARSFVAFGEGNTFYFPIDFASVVKRVLDWIQPAMIVIIDTEIWPNTVHQANRRDIPVMLVNGRISANSFRYYRRARPLLRKVFGNYRALLMQSDEDASRIARMGAPFDKIFVTGNIKIDRGMPDPKSEETLRRNLEESFAFSTLDAPLIVAGSTHPGEEQILLDALRHIRQKPSLEETRLLLAPRHPERFDEVTRLAEQNGFKVCRRSGGPCTPAEAAVLILNSIGELAAAYRFATIAFVGGTLVRHGGHSILEPALHSKAIVVGTSVENFRQIVEEFRAHGGVRQIGAGPEAPELQLQQLLDVFLHLLQNAKEREDLGRAAFSILERNRGTTQRAGERIAAVFEKVSGK